MRLPPVFIVQLKRWRLDEDSPVLDIVKPDELIDVAGCKYELRGVVMHLGRRATRGHYACLVKSGDDGTRLLYDDSNVSETSFDRCLYDFVEMSQK